MSRFRLLALALVVVSALAAMAIKVEAATVTAQYVDDADGPAIDVFLSGNPGEVQNFDLAVAPPLWIALQVISEEDKVAGWNCVNTEERPSATLPFLVPVAMRCTSTMPADGTVRARIMLKIDSADCVVGGAATLTHAGQDQPIDFPDHSICPGPSDSLPVVYLPTLIR